MFNDRIYRAQEMEFHPDYIITLHYILIQNMGHHNAKSSTVGLL